MYLGSWKIDDQMTFPAITHSATNGALTDADAVPDYRVYEDETGTAMLTGSMAKLDDANTTGFYSEQLSLSAANGFEKGKCYTIYITAIVGAITGGTHHTFQIEAEVDANSATLTAAAISDAVWDEAIAGHVAAGSTGEALGDAAAGGGLTAADIADAVWDEALAGHVGAGSAGAALGDIDLTVIDGKLDSIITDLDALPVIQAVTDQFTFTQAGNVDANIQYVNDVQVQGTGANGNEWRPV